ncbi:Mur ligase [Pluralibacter gergoviae]
MELIHFHRQPAWTLPVAEAAKALHAESLPEPYPGCVLFVSAGEPEARATVAIGRGDTFAGAWRQALGQLELDAGKPPRWLRVDVVNHVEALTVAVLKAKCARTKRSYFRFGLSFDPQFERALLEQEISGNAILYHSDTPVAGLNDGNLRRYGKRRFGEELAFPQEDDAPVWRFQTAAFFMEEGRIYPVCARGRESGYRELNDWPGEHLDAAIASASGYLARQVHDSGRYDYGWFPCFDRPIPRYNALRHASATYALLEGWEHTRNPAEFEAITRALDYLTGTLIHSRPLPDGKMADFLVDEGDEVKLGGNALSILALAKYTALTDDRRYLPQMLRLARTLRFMQDPQSGAFVHVLNYPDLSLKAVERIIYYDGEAAFALMRLYALTGQPWLLETVQLAFDSFIAREHWRAHDHWLSYCVNELVAVCPEARYFRFGLDNVSGHLDFVLNRVTTYPTLLELMMAAQQMLEKLDASEHRYLLDDFDRETFDRALAHRARYLMNGFFWPELAMFFANPARIVGSFFIRHHAWRVRIDDVEHYLSGLTAWHRLLHKRQPAAQDALPAGGAQRQGPAQA